MKSIKEAGQKAKSWFDSEHSNDWIKWFHTGIPDGPENVRQAIRAAAAIQGHCLKCTGISGGYFINSKTKCPEYPQHKYCHCKKQESETPFVKAHCDIRKFSDYIFAEKYSQNGKGNLFLSLGFTKEDSGKLKEEFENQASKQYAFGNYTLGKLDKNGQ